LEAGPVTGEGSQDTPGPGLVRWSAKWEAEKWYNTNCSQSPQRWHNRINQNFL